MNNSFQPENLEHAVDYLLSKISDTEDSIKSLEGFYDNERGFISAIHFSIGLNIRNAWFLWWHDDHGYPAWPSEKPDIVKYFNSIEIYHADDMSGIILTTVFRRYYNKPIDLESQIKVYHDHWLASCGNINPMAK
jgi:hypothetical protein